MKRLLLLACVLVAAPAAATEYFIGTGGSNSNDCLSAGTACLTPSMIFNYCSQDNTLPCNENADCGGGNTCTTGLMDSGNGHILTILDGDYCADGSCSNGRNGGSDVAWPQVETKRVGHADLTECATTGWSSFDQRDVILWVPPSNTCTNCTIRAQNYHSSCTNGYCVQHTMTQPTVVIDAEPTGDSLGERCTGGGGDCLNDSGCSGGSNYCVGDAAISIDGGTDWTIQGLSVIADTPLIGYCETISVLEYNEFEASAHNGYTTTGFLLGDEWTGPAAGNAIIRYNRFKNYQYRSWRETFGISGMTVGHNFIYVEDSPKMEIYGNVFGGSVKMFALDRCDDCKVYDNLMFEHTAHGVSFKDIEDVDGDGCGFSIYNNIVAADYRGRCYNKGTCSTAGGECMVDDDCPGSETCDPDTPGSDGEPDDSTRGPTGELCGIFGSANPDDDCSGSDDQCRINDGMCTQGAAGGLCGTCPDDDSGTDSFTGLTCSSTNDCCSRGKRWWEFEKIPDGLCIYNNTVYFAGSDGDWIQLVENETVCNTSPCDNLIKHYNNLLIDISDGVSSADQLWIKNTGTNPAWLIDLVAFESNSNYYGSSNAAGLGGFGHTPFRAGNPFIYHTRLTKDQRFGMCCTSSACTRHTGRACKCPGTPRSWGNTCTSAQSTTEGSCVDHPTVRCLYDDQCPSGVCDADAVGASCAGNDPCDVSVFQANGNCSVTTSTECTMDDDCPGAETCNYNSGTRWDAIDVTAGEGAVDNVPQETVSVYGERLDRYFADPPRDLTPCTAAGQPTANCEGRAPWLDFGWTNETDTYLDNNSPVGYDHGIVPCATTDFCGNTRNNAAGCDVGAIDEASSCGPSSGATPGTETNCSNSVDDDLDGNTDCADSDCDGVGSCEFGTEVTCNDTIDNDADTLTDCADPDCNTDPACLPSGNQAEGATGNSGTVK